LMRSSSAEARTLLLVAATSLFVLSVRGSDSHHTSEGHIFPSTCDKYPQHQNEGTFVPVSSVYGGTPHHPPLPTRSSVPQKPELPHRFLLAAKGDLCEGWKRYHSTVAWRRANLVDEILSEPQPHFLLIKQHYPHFIHLRGYRNEPVYYEKPARMNLKELRQGGVSLETLLRHFIFVTEFLWTVVEPSESGKSIYVIDLEGIRLLDFVGEAISFVRKASDFTSKHYPERAGSIYVVNVPSWFNTIWKVVR